MLEHLSESSEICLGFKVSDKLTEGDYAAFLPKLDEAIATHGKINMLMMVFYL